MSRLEKPVRFQSDVWLEGRLALVEEAKGIVVFSHPYPLMGGDMENGVVRVGCHHLNRLGFSTLRYNYRGVGESEGSFDDGNGEVLDLIAASEFAQSQAPGSPLLLAGYSFGSFITWNALPKIEKAKAVALISPAFSLPRSIFNRYEDDTRPVFACIGDRDPFCSLELFRENMDRIAPDAEIWIKENMDHFWISGIDQMARHLTGFYWTVLEP